MTYAIKPPIKTLTMHPPGKLVTYCHRADSRAYVRTEMEVPITSPSRVAKVTYRLWDEATGEGPWIDAEVHEGKTDGWHATQILDAHPA